MIALTTVVTTIVTQTAMKSVQRTTIEVGSKFFIIKRE